MQNLDFSAMESVLSAVQEGASSEAIEQEAQAHSVPRKLGLDAKDLLEDVQKKKKESELALRSQGKKIKKVDKSKGFFEKLDTRDKRMKKAGKPKLPKKGKKRSNMFFEE